ncbi:hypothetical protein EDB84DRAFT_1567344 [Lactarius hengduanensis]|nr:hypothetical protein EDB84DRAFT_1567344 [Lactarius hengduanensis]
MSSMRGRNKVGTAGPQGLVQHQGKKKCLATIKKKKQAAEIAKRPTLFSYLRREDSSRTVTDLAREAERKETESSSRVVVSQVAILKTVMHASQCKDLDPSADLYPCADLGLDSVLDVDLDRAWDLDRDRNRDEVRARVGGCEATPARRGCRDAWLLLDRLRDKIGKVPDDVLEEGEGNEPSYELSGYNKAAALSICADVPQDELWENVNPGLDRILGFRRPQEEIVVMVCSSRVGLQGLYEYLEVLVEEGGVVGGLLEGKVTALLMAMELDHPRTATQALLPVPLPIPGTRELPIEVLESKEMARTPARGSISSRKRSTRATKPTTNPCSGAYLAMPDGVLPYSAYPFMLHEVFVLPWHVHLVGPRMSIQSIHCAGVRETSSDSLEGILHRISNGIHTNTVYAYQPIAGLIEILRKKCAMLDGLRFKQLSVSRTLATRARTVGQYEQLVMAMSEGTVNRMDALLRAGLNRGNFTEEERSRGLLFLRLGGARVASLAHQTLGAPTLSTLRYGSSTVTSLSPSAGFPTRSEIQGNIRAAFKNSSGSGACGYVLMIDEIKVEERMRWDPSTDKILGLCREHTEHVGLDFCSMSDAKALVHGILRGELHHASEATVFSIGVLSGNRHTWGSRPFIIAGTCKREDADRHARLISTVVEAYGESRRGSALTTLTQKRLLDPNSELHVLLGKLRLLNLLSGVMINGFVVTPALLRFHFQANNVPPHRISYLLNPADRQDVPLCYTFMKEVWSLPPPAPTDKPSFVAARDALRMLGSLFRHLVLPFVQVSLSLHEQLVHLSAAAHLATFLFTAKSARSKAMPSLTFKDIVLLVKNAYFCVAKAKIYTPDGDFYLILNGTDLAGIHLRRCTIDEHPAWDRGPRRLHLRGIEDGNGDVLSKSDHITPASWKGNVNVRNVSLITAWNLGPILKMRCWSWRTRVTDMEFPFGQVAKGLEEPEDGDCEQDDDSDQIHVTPETADGIASLTAQDATALISSLTLGEGEGPLLDLEDHASIETSRDGRGMFSPLINIEDSSASSDRRMVPKARVLRELERATFSKVPGSTDRLNHCAGLSRYTKTSPLPDLSGGVIDSTSKGLLSIGDPAATVVQCEGQFFLAIIQINEILFDTSPVLEISPRFLMEPAVTVQFQIYQIVETSKDDPNVDGADWKWNRKMERAVLKTKGSFIQVIDPAIAIPEANAPVYYFRTDELRAIAACLFSSVPVQDRGRLPRLPKRSDYSRTARIVRTAAFVCEVELDERAITGPTSAQSDCCPMCRPATPWDISKTHKILEHVASHLLFDSTLDTTQELCGLCMRPSPQCAFYLRKGKGAGSAPQIDERVTSCPNFTGKLSYLSAATERTNSPCTNVPIICRLCPSTSAAVWKYNMKTHRAQFHPSTTGGEFPREFVVSESEKAALKVLWETRFTISRRRRKHNVTTMPLVISEVHSSCQAFSSSLQLSPSDSAPANDEIEDDCEASSQSDSSSQSSARHRVDKQGNAGNLDAYSEYESGAEFTLDYDASRDERATTPGGPPTPGPMAMDTDQDPDAQIDETNDTANQDPEQMRAEIGGSGRALGNDSVAAHPVPPTNKTRPYPSNEGHGGGHSMYLRNARRKRAEEQQHSRPVWV